MKAGALKRLTWLAMLALTLTAAPAAAATIQVTIDRLVYSPTSGDAK
ncbi:amicyanin, partial [Mesorhizobium sp. M8A.F.Ca.ET.023.01.1.1]